jgi:signal transduction histidine kinase
MNQSLQTIKWLLLAIIIFQSCNQPGKGSQIPIPENAVLDLRKTNLSEEQVSLAGDWKFYWHQLLTPASQPVNHSLLVKVPSLWNQNIAGAEKRSAIGYGTYTLTVLLPKEKPRLAIKIPDVYSSYKLFANSILIAQNGEPDSTASKAIPFWSLKTVNLPPLGDTLHLLMQTANFWHAKGGTHGDLVIGESEELLLQHNRNAAMDLLLAGCLFMGGLFFFGLFVFARKDKIILYFSLFCINTSYRMIGTDAYVLHTLFPQISWFAFIRMEYMSLVLGVSLFTQYTRMLYPKDSNQTIMKSVIGLSFVYAFFILFFPVIVFTSLLIVYLAVMFLYIGYSLFVYSRAVHNKRSGSIYALLSSGVMLLVYLAINLQYFNVIAENKIVAFIGYISFFFLQSLVLSHRFSETLQNAAMQAKQGLKVKAEFLSTMSHEIRTPLNSVVGMAYLLQRSKPRPDQKEQLDVLMFSASNLLSIVNNILDYNKIEEGKISIEQIAMDLPAIARNIVAGLSNLANDKLIALKLDIDDKLTMKVLGDPTRTSQVLNNLLHNAIKFTKEGEVSLTINVEKIENGFVRIHFSVRDTGIGIHPEKQQLIFERFTQADSSISRSFGGTGLGLSISKKILRLQGAELKLKSKPGLGSEFYFTQIFPLTTEKVEAVAVISQGFPEDAKPLENTGILLVEDNPLNVLVAQTFLERCGAIVDIATNGKEALEKLDSNKHRLVLMDLEMPVMDGYEATRLMREKGECMPVIALTASLPKEVESDIYAVGFSDIIVKPFNPDDLYRIILQHLEPTVV